MSKEGSLHRHLMVNRRDLASALLVVIAWTWIEFWLRRNADGFSNDLCALTLLLLFLVFWMSYRRSSRSDILWPSESRLDPEKIDLKFEVAWSNRRLSEFGGFFSGLFGKSSMYLTRMVVSKEAGLELHYKETLNGLDEVAHLELDQVSSVHYWYFTTSTYDTDSGRQTKRRSYRLAIKAGSVIHKIDNIPRTFIESITILVGNNETQFGGDVPKKIIKLCDILELKPRKIKPRGTEFWEIYEMNIKEPKDNNGNHETASIDNRTGPDGTESGPDVPEDWYLTYDGPAPIVEGIYDQNYGVDRGNGAVPVEFYIKKWGVPEGFGKTDHEKLWWMED